MDIITRQEAKERGLKRYFTGKPCERGHVCERLVSSWNCVECHNINGRDYVNANHEKVIERQRKYREDNLEKCREGERRYREANREEYRERLRQWFVDNRERHKENGRKWRKANLEKAREYGRKYKLANREMVRQNNREYQAANPEKMNARLAKRRALKLNATPSWLTQAQLEDIADIYVKAKRAEQRTGVKHHVDHIEPLQGKDRCGLHVPWNLQVLEAGENFSKGNRAKKAGG